MRPSVLCLFALLLTSASLSATEVLPTDGYVPTVIQAPAVESPLKADAPLNLSKVTVRESAAASDGVPAQLGPSGSFWWLVGVIVVSGVILAIIL